MTRAALYPSPRGYPTNVTKRNKQTAAIGNRKTSVLLKKGSDRYPRCVMYQYHDKAPAYIKFDKASGSNPSPKTNGSKKNCTPSVRAN